MKLRIKYRLVFVAKVLDFGQHLANCMQLRSVETRRFPFIPLSVSDWLIRKHHPIRDDQTKFCLPKRNFKRNFVVSGTKCHAKFRTFAQNFNNIGTIGTSKYRRKFAFLEISYNFGKFRRNSLSLLLHSIVKLHVLAR